MIEPVGAAAAVTATIDQSIKLIQRVSTAIELYKDGNRSLETLHSDLCSTKEIIGFVKALAWLKTGEVEAAANNILKHVTKVQRHLEHVEEKSSPSRSKPQRIVHQLFSGPEERESIDRMVVEFTALKATLTLQIQVAHIGVSVARDQERSGCTHILNSVILQQVNHAVEQRLGKGRGLKIVKELQGKQPDANGMIQLCEEEYQRLLLHLEDNEEVNKQLDAMRVANHSSFENEFQLNGPTNGLKPMGTTQIRNNIASGDAFQLNGPQSAKDDGEQVTQNLIAEANEARDQSFQVNGPIGADSIQQLLTAKVQCHQSTPRCQDWSQQPPPMPQHQPTTGHPQEWQAMQRLCYLAQSNPTFADMFGFQGIRENGVPVSLFERAAPVDMSK